VSVLLSEAPAASVVAAVLVAPFAAVVGALLVAVVGAPFVAVVDAPLVAVVDAPLAAAPLVLADAGFASSPADALAGCF
jgi:hypothetical protein